MTKIRCGDGPYLALAGTAPQNSIKDGDEIGQSVTLSSEREEALDILGVFINEVIAGVEDAHLGYLIGLVSLASCQAFFRYPLSTTSHFISNGHNFSLQGGF